MSTPSVELSAPDGGFAPSRQAAGDAASWYRLVVWLLIGISACSIVSLQIAIPLRLTICTAFCLVIVGTMECRLAERGILTRLVAVFFSLPFSACLGYLFDPQFIWWRTALAMPLCRDEPLIARMIWVGLVGFLGLLSGVRLYGLSTARPAVLKETPRVLPGHLFLGLLGTAVLLSQLSAPPETILVASYASGQTESLAGSLNFKAAFLISYLILILLYIDSEHEAAGSSMRRSKQRWLFAACAYIVVVLQILRGDRECFGLIIGIAALYVTGGSFQGDWWQARRAAALRVVRVSLPILCIIFVFLLLGFLRSMLSESGMTAQTMKMIANRVLTLNTWTGVLLTNLGLAEEEAHHSIQLLGGKTYIDYLLSLPPGILADAVGYQRPLDGQNSPNWWYIPLSGGGVHPVVVPYKNFGIAGVFAVLAGIGMLIARCERYAAGYGFGNRLLFGSIATITPLWIWYGDMNFLRMLITYVGLWLIYRVFAVVRPTHLSPLQATP